jgi:hypothetical protein
MVMPNQGYYGVLGSEAVQALKGLINTRDCVSEAFVFENKVIRPDVLVNGESAKDCKNTSDVLCLNQNKLIVPQNICTSETQITLYPGSPPMKHVYSAKNLCDVFPSNYHKGHDHTPYSMRCYYEYILGLGIPLSGGVLVAGVTVCLIIILCTYRKRSKKGKFSPKDDGAEELGFGVKAEDEAEERFVGGQMSARNTFERFLTEVEAICKAARPENVLALLSLGQRCQRSSCKDSCCSHPPFYLHIKIGETELLVNYVESIEPDALKVSADSIVSYAKSSKVSKSYRGFVFYRDAAVDPRALALLDDCWSKNGIGFYNVDIIERDPLWYKLWKDLLQTLIRHEGTTAGYVCEEQAESDDVSDGTSPPTETETRDVHVVSIEVTDNELEKNEHVIGSGIIRRSRSWQQNASRGKEENSDMNTNVSLYEGNLPQFTPGSFEDIEP